MQIEKLSAANLKELTHLVIKLWPDCSFEEEYPFYEGIIGDENQACFLIKDAATYAAFIHVTLRFDYVEGADSSPVGYIEGLYVKPEYRKNGFGKTLVDVAEQWAKEKGCREIASDAEITNEASIQFHQQAGFSEANRIVCFIKQLG
jgi:aminoglycoside 6'-N-acetyltransferase I